VVVAEGYMDVIAFVRAGLPFAVAPLGTAITEEQLKSLWRLADEPILCLDGDAAGLRAAARAAERALPLLEPGRSLGFALLPDGEDPDSLLAGGGPEALRAAIARPLDLADFLWRSAIAGGVPTTPERRAALELRLRQLAHSVGHPAVRAHYVAAVRERLDAAGLGRGGPRRRSSGRRDERRDAPVAPTIATRSSAPERLPGRKLLRAVLLRPQMLPECEEAVAALGDHDPQLGPICGEILAWYAQAPDLDANLLASHLTRYGFGELVDRVLAHRPWVRGALAESVDGVAASGTGQRVAPPVEAQHPSDAGPASTEAAGDGQFRTLYRILRSMGADDDGNGHAGPSRE
jgi:DNA primase